jgi:hypothetical protein
MKLNHEEKENLIIAFRSKERKQLAKSVSKER